MSPKRFKSERIDLPINHAHLEVLPSIKQQPREPATLTCPSEGARQFHLSQEALAAPPPPTLKRSCKQTVAEKQEVKVCSHQDVAKHLGGLRKIQAHLCSSFRPVLPSTPCALVLSSFLCEDETYTHTPISSRYKLIPRSRGTTYS